METIAVAAWNPTQSGHSEWWGDEETVRRVLTYGAVGARPVGLADAGPRVRVEGAVTGALLGTSALQDLAADAAPARVTVALTVMTGSVTGARRVHTVHWGHTARATAVSVYHEQTAHQTSLFTSAAETPPPAKKPIWRGSAPVPDDGRWAAAWHYVPCFIGGW